jgi:hypothetical protein
MKKRLVLFCLLFIFIFSSIAYAQTCEVAHVRNNLRKMLYEYFQSPSTATLELGKIKDLLDFYLQIPTQDQTVDCTGVGQQSGVSYEIIVQEADGITTVIPKCSDSTEFGSCSDSKPFYCYNGELVRREEKCGSVGNETPTTSCGDNVCQEEESCSTCSTDCGSCPIGDPSIAPIYSDYVIRAESNEILSYEKGISFAKPGFGVFDGTYGNPYYGKLEFLTFGPTYRIYSYNRPPRFEPVSITLFNTPEQEISIHALTDPDVIIEDGTVWDDDDWENIVVFLPESYGDLEMFYVSKDGSSYYGQASSNGGVIYLTPEEALVPGNLARAAISSAVCGDNVCEATESCSTCSLDCGSCQCGNNVCEFSESCSTCSRDCGSCRFSALNIIPIDQGSYAQWQATIGGDKIVWQDTRDGPGWSARMYDLSTNQGTLLGNPGDGLKIGGNNVIWQEWYTEEGMEYNYKYKTILYDISTGNRKTMLETDSPLSARKTSVGEDKVVYFNESAGDVYVYDISTSQNSLLLNTRPISLSIEGDKLVLEGTGKIFLYDISSGTPNLLFSDLGSNPFITGNKIYYNQEGQNLFEYKLLVMEYDLSTGQISLILDSIENEQLTLKGADGDRIVYDVRFRNQSQSSYSRPSYLYDTKTHQKILVGELKDISAPNALQGVWSNEFWISGMSGNRIIFVMNRDDVYDQNGVPDVFGLYLATIS